MDDELTLPRSEVALSSKLEAELAFDGLAGGQRIRGTPSTSLMSSKVLASLACVVVPILCPTKDNPSDAGLRGLAPPAVSAESRKQLGIAVPGGETTRVGVIWTCPKLLTGLTGNEMPLAVHVLEEV